MIAFRVQDAEPLDIVGKEKENAGFFDDLNDEISENDDSVYTDSDNGEFYAGRLKKAIWTGNCDLSDDDDIVIMTLEAATTGRLSITYYKEMSGSKYKYCIEKWNRECRWYNYSFKDKKEKEWTPSLESIVKCAYGVEQGNFVVVKDKLKKMTVSRLLPCVIEAKNIPTDIVKRAVLNVSRANCFSQKNWNRILRSACAVIHKYYVEKGVEYDMVLEDCKERDYLYGRLLAVADMAEREAMRQEQGNERCTNAQRYMVAFQKKPYRTWQQIRKSIQPYLKKLKGSRREEYLNAIDKITDSMSMEEFSRNDALNGTYLLGYSNQRRTKVYHKEDKKDE
jgi:CRISPR-associated protein Csd1